MTTTERLDVPLAQIEADPDNVRVERDDPEVDNLAANILQHGLLHPIVVYPIGADGHYRISGGHRRFKAAQQLGWDTIAVTVIETPATALKRLDLMAAENLQRKQLDPIEKGLLFRRYIDRGLKQKDIAERLNVSAGLVSQVLSMLDLPGETQQKIKAREIPWAQAVKLATQHRNEGKETPHGTYGRVKAPGLVAPYFNGQHPLCEKAKDLCLSNAHPTYMWIGQACGRCWESAIRLDERSDSPIGSPVVPPQVRRFSHPREILRLVRCERCGIGALERPDDATCFLPGKAGEHRKPVREHAFPLPVQVAS